MASRPTSWSACSAVLAEIGTTAAWAKVRLAGLRASFASGATAYSANDPGATPYTSSPTVNRFTEEPTSATTPATSRPGTGFLGRRRPKPSRIA